MKVLTAYIVSPILYALGHAVSIVCDWLSWPMWLYPLYNRLMIGSGDIEAWAGIELMWRTIQDTDGGL